MAELVDQGLIAAVGVYRLPLMRASLFLLLAALTSVTAIAQTPKSGLWELETHMHTNRPDEDAKLAKATANGSPGEDAMVTAMLEQLGRRVVALLPDGIRMQVCLTDELAARLMTVEEQVGCTVTRTVSGSTTKSLVMCTEPPMSAEIQTTLLGTEGFTSEEKRSGIVQGGPITLTISGEGHWISSDCGGLKPLAKMP